MSINCRRRNLIGYLFSFFILSIFFFRKPPPMRGFPLLAKSMEAIGDIRRFIKIPYSPGISRGRPRSTHLLHVTSRMYRVNRERHSPSQHRFIHAIYIYIYTRCFFLISSRNKRATRGEKKSEMDGKSVKITHLSFSIFLAFVRVNSWNSTEGEYSWKCVSVSD